jgi:phosphoglucosamine mutase
MAYTPIQEAEIEQLYNSKAYGNVSWEYIGSVTHNTEIKKQYMNDLLNTVNIKKGLKVVIDAASGAGSELSPIIFRKAGCDVITLNSQVDGFFPGRNPEPNKTNLQNLMKVVVATGADLGIAHDGDADRMMAVDENGNISEFDKLLALISKNFGGTVVTTVDAGLCMDEVMEKVGGKVIRTKVGDVAVAESIIKNDATFGGEPSGTWVHPDFCMCPDGLLSGLRIAEIVSKEGPLSKLLNEISSYFSIREKVVCSKEDKLKVFENMEEQLKEEFDDIKYVNSIDGIRLTFDDGSWVLLRPSGTEDYIRITLEAKTEEKAELIRQKCVFLIEKNLS